MFQLLLMAAAGAAGYFLGKHMAPSAKDHTAMIELMAFANKDQRKAILSVPATPSITVPGPSGQMTITPPIPLFTADEKREILKEVAAKQQELLKAGQTLTPAQLVTPDEIELRPAAVPSPAPAPMSVTPQARPTVMAGYARPLSPRPNIMPGFGTRPISTRQNPAPGFGRGFHRGF